jgi:hypothetical protein
LQATGRCDGFELGVRVDSKDRPNVVPDSRFYELGCDGLGRDAVGQKVKDFCVPLLASD